MNMIRHFRSLNSVACLAGLALTALLLSSTAFASDGRFDASQATFHSLTREEMIAKKVAEVTHGGSWAVAQGVDHPDGHAGDHHDDCGRCVTLSGMSILFDPAADEVGVLSVLQQLPDEQFASFLPQGSRWTATATDGAVAQGERLTLTYSFVPDGTPITIAGTVESEPSSLFTRFDANFPGGRVAWKAKFAQALNQWGEILNITYVEVADDGAAFPTSAGALGLRGDIRIAMRSLGEPLAVNFFPQFGGDMVLDSLDIGQFVNPVNDYLNLRNILTHEHGHGLGLNHVLPTDSTKLMEPFLSTAYDGPQEDDIRGAQSLYGDRFEANNVIANNSFLGGPLTSPTNGAQVLTFDNMALERADSADFYGFTAFAGVPIAIRVDPIGTTYQFAPQSNPNLTTTVNAKAVRNLGLRLWRRVSAQTNTFQLLAQIDFNGAGEAEYHPPIPYQTAGYMVAEVYSIDGFSDCQRYSIRISNAALTPPVAPASMSVFNVAAGQQIFDGSTLQFGNANTGANVNRTLTIVNGGPGALDLGQPTFAGPGAADFAFNMLTSTIAPDGTTTIVVVFTPSVAGLRQAVMTLPNNDPNQPNFSFIVSGTGVVQLIPEMEVSLVGATLAENDLVELDGAEIGTAATISLELLNTGTATLNISNIDFTGNQSAEYSASFTQATIAPGASTTLSLTCVPADEGDRITLARFFSNAVPSPFRLELRTQGLAVEPQITDCNANGIEDAQDIESGASMDCDANGIPDECEIDSDGDDVIDACDLCADEDDRIDLNGNGVPDCTEIVNDNPDNNNNNNGDNENQNAGGNNGLCGMGAGTSLLTFMLMACGGTVSQRRRYTARRVK
ncbi:MAG: choice-of-anchor D domain-containing protein [Phycisphaerae bacterium]|nr:choice-of-anchor D domain-containing protein [Phycisphaerae bacterium]